MDTSQETNQEEFQDLENVESIDDRVLNTPAEERKITIPKIDEGQQMETFLQFNRTQQVETEGGIILDLAGEKAEIEEEDLSAETNTMLLRKITGESLSADELVNPGAFLIIIMVALGLFGFLIINFKRSEEINILQKEINKLKNRTDSII